MRIAICLSGHVRSYQTTHPHFVEALINPNAGHQIDIFLSTWSNIDAIISGHNFRVRAIPPQVPINLDDILARYRPVKYHIDEAIDLSHVRDFDIYKLNMRPGTIPIAIFSMFYKMGHADKLRQQYQEEHGFTYDAVVRTRFDLIYPRPFILTEFDLNFLHLPSMIEGVYRPVCEWCGRAWRNDKFAIASAENMRRYALLHDYMNQMWDDGVPMQPEVMLHEHLVRQNVPYAELGHELTIIRNWG